MDVILETYQLDEHSINKEFQELKLKHIEFYEKVDNNSLNNLDNEELFNLHKQAVDLQQKSIKLRKKIQDLINEYKSLAQKYNYLEFNLESQINQLNLYKEQIKNYNIDSFGYVSELDLSSQVSRVKAVINQVSETVDDNIRKLERREKSNSKNKTIEIMENTKESMNLLKSENNKFTNLYYETMKKQINYNKDKVREIYHQIIKESDNSDIIAQADDVYIELMKLADPDDYNYNFVIPETLIFKDSLYAITKMESLLEE